ncbi:hypothetical protein [Thalassobacillus pellis]|uniref:hypothetical protein n=1 Tax=Thalassobacillus pellis TaxID=748008 RepID=UPI001961C024|nr:hypothetical protein [Thalassobacillus pellis]MBM7554522.1 hypothetical protein [Thalassobacillus pellis]
MPISRNKLTEKLLEDGLRSQSPSFFQQSDRDSVLTIPLSGFSPAEVALLQSKQGQRILYNVLQLLLGQALGESFSSMPGAREQKSEGGQATERKPEEVPSSYTLDAPASTVNERKQVAPVSTRDVLEKLRRKRHLLHPN